MIDVGVVGAGTFEGNCLIKGGNRCLFDQGCGVAEFLFLHAQIGQRNVEVFGFGRNDQFAADIDRWLRLTIPRIVSGMVKAESCVNPPAIIVKPTMMAKTKL